jgi:hypothetical protein
MTGGELRERLDARIRWHEERRDEFARALTPSDDPESRTTPLPSDIIEHMRNQHDMRASVLLLIHDHVEASETYRLGEPDLVFAEMIPKTDED